MPTLDRTNAMTATYFHPADSCAQVVTYGPRGGAHYPRTEVWRRNGATQTWKTRPTEFRVPVKYGMYDYGSLRSSSAYRWHVGTAEECPDGTLAESLAADLTRRFGETAETVR